MTTLHSLHKPATTLQYQRWVMPNVDVYSCDILQLLLGPKTYKVLV